MFYLIINNENEIVKRFISLNRALMFLEEQNDDLILQVVTAEEYEEMNIKFEEV